MLVYSKNGYPVDGVVGQYRNPDYFEKAYKVDKVLLIGDYPHIKKAYEAIGVAVEQINPSEEKAEDEVAVEAKSRTKKDKVNDVPKSE